MIVYTLIYFHNTYLFVYLIIHLHDDQVMQFTLWLYSIIVRSDCSIYHECKVRVLFSLSSLEFIWNHYIVWHKLNCKDFDGIRACVCSLVVNWLHVWDDCLNHVSDGPIDRSTPLTNITRKQTTFYVTINFFWYCQILIISLKWLSVNILSHITFSSHQSC